MSTEPTTRRPKRGATADAQPRPQRLTREFSTFDHTAMSDLLSILMANIEDGLIQSGAVPGVDYTFRDLATWAMPMIYSGWDEDKLRWEAPPPPR